MIVSFPATRPKGAAPRQRTGQTMDVTLHFGAHRCATSSFQHYMRQNAQALGRLGIGFCGPHRTRNGLFDGLMPGPAAATRRNRSRRAIGRIQMRMSASRARGVRNLVVSDENMLGTIRDNLRRATLYAGAGERAARLGQAFDGYVSDVVLNIRSPEMYWSSALAFGAVRGCGLPDGEHLERLASGLRSWRDVITDLACALPGVRLWVLPFEIFAGRPDAQLCALTGQDVPRTCAGHWLNAAPRLPELRDLFGPAAGFPDGQGRWSPFSPAQSAGLKERYADDLMWLASGADGLAWLMDDPEKNTVGPNLPPPDMTRGCRNDTQGRLAGAG